MGLTLPIVCGICQQKFTAPAVFDLLQSDTGRERLGTILETLVEHVKVQHKQAYQIAALQASQLLRLIALMQFQTEDKGAVQLRDFMRYQLWLTLQKHRPGNDEELTAMAGQMGDQLRSDLHVPLQYLPKIKSAFLDVLKQCRDIWCEQGKFQPQPLMPANQPANGKPTLAQP